MKQFQSENERNNAKACVGTALAVQWLGHHLPGYRGRAGVTLLRELRAHMPRSQKSK